MSTFMGRLVDPALSFIAIDYFEDSVYNCDLFLLSHHHCDHMNGILTQEFGHMINESNKLVYCSPITAHFLRKNPKCRIRNDKIRQLEICKPMVLQQDHNETHVVVTSLPAAHCMGSVMFLIEYNEKRIIYSGDIRLTLKDLKCIHGGVTNSDGSPIAVDDLYLDTTFAVQTHLEDFPSREMSEKTIIDFIKNGSSKGKVILDIAARFGYETLFINLYKTFAVPVMVHDYAMVYYEDIEQIRDYVIPHSRCKKSDWLFHACLNYSNKNCDLVEPTTPVNVFKPCALGFVNFSNDKVKKYLKYGVPYVEQPNCTKVFYATHCSLNEIRDIYAFLQPKRMFPSVKGNQSTKDIFELMGVERMKRKSVEPTSPPRPNTEREEYEQSRRNLRKRYKFTEDD